MFWKKCYSWFNNKVLLNPFRLQKTNAAGYIYIPQKNYQHYPQETPRDTKCIQKQCFGFHFKNKSLSFYKRQEGNLKKSDCFCMQETSPRPSVKLQNLGVSCPPPPLASGTFSFWIWYLLLYRWNSRQGQCHLHSRRTEQASMNPRGRHGYQPPWVWGETEQTSIMEWDTLLTERCMAICIYD